MNLAQAIVAIDVHICDQNQHLKRAWNLVHLKVMEAVKTSHNSASAEVELLESAVNALSYRVDDEERQEVLGALNERIAQLRT